MVLTIGPAGSRAEIRKLLVIHGIGLFVGASVMAATCNLVAAEVSNIPEVYMAACGVIAASVLVLWAIRVTFGVGPRFPSSKWQVPVVWRETVPPIITVGTFGALLGVGFATSVVFPVYWILLGGSLVMPSLLASLAAWWIYAGMRIGTTAEATLRRFDATAPVTEIAEVAPTNFRTARALTVCALVSTAAAILFLLSS